MVHPQVRNEVPDRQIGPSKILADQEEYTEDDCQTNIARKNQLGIFCLIQRARRIEMVDASPKPVLLANATTFFLARVAIVAGDVGTNVHDPAHQLLTNKSAGGRDWGLLKELGQLMYVVTHLGGILLTSLRNKDHIPLYVTSGLVMLAMRDLPGEVWN